MARSGPSYRAGRCLLIGGKADIEPNITECPSLTDAVEKVGDLRRGLPLIGLPLLKRAATTLTNRPLLGLSLTQTMRPVFRAADARDDWRVSLGFGRWPRGGTRPAHREVRADAFARNGDGSSGVQGASRPSCARLAICRTLASALICRKSYDGPQAAQKKACSG